MTAAFFNEGATLGTELVTRLGTAVLRARAEELRLEERETKRRRDELAAEVDTLNARRRNEHREVGARLTALEARWADAVRSAAHLRAELSRRGVAHSSYVMA
jgi:uncharacterized protein YlxW (UPF0749 family)